ncbi:ankyrin repeat domain-containing protein [Azoarcus olearius]|uniref:Ankyrin repeat harbouring exported protein n=1 Tax=Azoarcus sp. (strain BH72) TaxID=418699 RepID=A1K5W1_AZOSB|nr:ankyrin repeat domain-containing protein [Azoarcus olearius]ANQ84766.1 ankyrin repeat-containing protein [Azoarcus olearius]CAL94216.1 putative ankyrin repeat harbouring exported protein [Azoarcus olearius]
MRTPDSARRFILVAALGACLCWGPARAGSYDDALSSARLGDTAQLQRLLERGIDPNTVDEQGNTLLILAAREGNADTVEALLRHRVALGQRNLAGDSALMLAVLRGYDRVAEMLIAAGAPVSHDGWSPLHYAAFEGRLEIAQRLLAAGAEVDAPAPNKSTPLMLAARNGHIEVVRLLLRAGASVDARNDAGQTADSWAMANGNTDIAALIRQERVRRGGEVPTLRIEIQ